MSPRLPSVLLIVALLGTVSAAAIEVVWPTSMDRASIRLPEDYLQATIMRSSSPEEAFRR